MKNISLIFLAICFLGTGCTKAVKDDGSDIDMSGYTTLKACIENLELPGYNPSVALWSKYDQVALFSDQSAKAVLWNVRLSSDGKADAVFYGPLVTGKKIFGVFPYDSSLEYNGISVVCELAAVQKISLEKSVSEHFIEYNPYVYGMVADGEIDFHYAYGLLKIDFNLAYPVTISGLSISDRTQPLSGRMMYDGTDLMETGASSNTIMFDFEGKNYQSDVLTTYTVIRPGTYEDLEVVITLADNDKIKLNVTPVTIQRITSENFTAGHITISTSDLPSLDQEDGYWEEDK